MGGHINGATRQEMFAQPRGETTSSVATSGDVTLERIECALSMMSRALVLAGFSEFEAGTVSLSTRTAISSIVTEKTRR